MEYLENDIVARNQKAFLGLIKRLSWILLAFCCSMQLIFHAEITNIYAMGIVILGWLIVTNVFLRPIILNNFPLSTFLMIGFAAVQLYFPLVFTTLEGKSLIYNLELPEMVFFHTLAAMVVLTIAHGFYRLLSKITYSRSFSLLGKAGFFDAPSEFQMWGMGIIGLAASLYVYFIAADVSKEVTGAASDKLVQGLVPFCYAPFFIPFSRLYGGKEPNMKKIGPALIVFTVLLFAISIGRNSRGAFMFGFTSVGFAYGLGLLLGLFEAKLFTVKNFVIAAFGFWLLTGPVADLGTAMVIVRGDRDDISASELLMLTVDAYGDKESIEARRRDDNTETVDLDWDERYLDNIFTARFANIKFNDMSLIQYTKMREYDPDMIDHSVDYILAGLPDPFLKFLGLDVDKTAVYSLSMGDFIYLVAGGYGTGFIAGFRVGHFAGIGMATFGWWYLLLLGLLMIPTFLLFDKFFKKKRVPTDDPGTQRIKFSCCGMLSLTSIFQFLPTESVVNIVTFLIRGWIQMAFLYFLIFHATRIAGNMLNLKSQIRFQGSDER